MLETQKDYLNELDKLIEEFKKCNLATDKLHFLKDYLSHQELLIPVVGDFSAGKSSMLNSFLGENVSILPTAITPETSIATELRYGTEERIEAIGKNGEVLKVYYIDEFDEINKHSSEYSYLKLYLNNSNIKSISPLILVDMPGFESPLDAHNDAIKKYLNRGSYFVVLVCATDGTLKTTAIRHLNDILEFNRDFSLVVSKSNLVSEDNLQAVISNIKDEIDINLGLEKNPVSIGKDGKEAIMKIVSDLNPETLFKTIVSSQLLDSLYQIESSLNIKISAFHKDTSENDELIQNLAKSIEKVISEKDAIKAELSSSMIEQQSNLIISNIGSKLSSSIDSLVEIGIKGGNEALNSEIQDTLYSSLVVNVKESVRNMYSEITSKFSVELENLNSQLNAYIGDGDFINNVTKNTMMICQSNAPSTVLNEVGDFVESKTYIALTGLLAITTSVLTPIVEIAIIILPGLIKKFFDKRNENRARDEFRDLILTSIIPELKRKLSDELPEILEKNLVVVIEEIANRYSVLIEEKQTELKQAEIERQQKANEIQSYIESLSGIKDELGKFLEITKQNV